MLQAPRLITLAAGEVLDEFVVGCLKPEAAAALPLAEKLSPAGNLGITKLFCQHLIVKDRQENKTASHEIFRFSNLEFQPQRSLDGFANVSPETFDM